MSSSAFQPSQTLSWKKGAALLDQLSAKKEQSAPMVDYLFDKVNLAENLRKLSFNLSEQDLKEHIFKGLPQHYVQFFDEWRMDSLTVVGNKLIAEEMKLKQANGGSMVNPLRGRRPEKESYRGDVMVLMTLVITLLFQVAAKSSDDVFSPLKDLSSCDCHGSGPTWACDCTPHAFVIYHVLLAVGFSVSVLSLMRIIFLIQHCFWLVSGIIGVVLAFAWTVYSATPTEYRLLVLVIDLMAFVGIGTLMLLVAYYQIHWVSLKILKKAASLVWTALQYGIVAIWTLTQFVFGQGWHACKTCGTSLKHLWDEAFIRAPPPDDAAPV